MKGLRLLALLASCLVASCIDGREEVWIHADGSGRAEVLYSLPAAAASFQGGETGVQRLIEGFLRDAPAIHSARCEVTTADDRLHIRVRAAFDSALDLQQISTSGSLSKLPAPATGLAGDVRVLRQGLGVDFSRTITAGEALPGFRFLPESRVAGHRLTYLIHLPAAASESNATRTEDDGRTLIWEIPLATALRGPVVTRFKAPVPVPLWVVATGCGIGVLGVFLVWKLFRAKSPAA